MKSTSLPCVKLTLLVVMVHVAVVVRARPGTRHERQDLRMLPANATGTPQDQALAGGVVLEEAAVLAAQSPVAAQAPAPAQEMASTTASSVKAADVWRKLPSPSGPISHPASPGSGLSMSVGSSGPTSTVGPSATTVATTAATHATTPAHGQDRNKGHSGVASDFAGEDSNIVFPSPPIKIDVGPAPTKFDPFSRAPSGRTPACAKGSTFCTDVDHYPENYLQTMLRSAAVGLGYKEYFGNDVIAESNITQRIDSMDENPLCPYEETVVYPKVAKNKDDKWLYVVNQDHYVQGVRIETCLNTGTACQLAENFPYGYTTSCRQKYILRKLVALNPEGQTSTDMFRLPSCCSCYVTRSSVSSRRSNMTPAITKSGSRKR